MNKPTLAEIKRCLLKEPTSYRIYECKVFDGEGNLKYVVSAEEQLERNLEALKTRLLTLLEGV
tara:strand:- start:13936 stop:14124 length:189 start_codon:yes stop_codon:yes gene_type:complete